MDRVWIGPRKVEGRWDHNRRMAAVAMAKDAPQAAAMRPSREQLGLKVEEDETLLSPALEVDAGHLCAFDPSPEDFERKAAKDAEAATLEVGQALVQAVIKAVFALPASRAEDGGRMVELPVPLTQLPRAKPPPKPREKTRWEKFAEAKGIQKRKRSKYEYDENVGEMRRRYGYKRLNDINDVPIIDAGPDDVVGEDPFSSKIKEKKAKVQSNQERRVSNLKKNLKSGGELPPTLKLNTSRPGEKKMYKKLDVELTNDVARFSTGSMGKFDKKLEGEKEGKPKGKRRHFDPIVNKQEKEKSSKLVNKLLAQHADDILDERKAASMEQVRQEKAASLKGKDQPLKGKKGGRKRSK